MEPDGSLHVLFTRVCHLSLSVAKLILSAPFLPISLRLSIIFSSHLPFGVIPLVFNVLFAQEIPCCICTQFLLLCSEEHTLVCILSKMMLVHTLRHISWRFILILAFSVCLGFCIGHLECKSLCYETAKLRRHFVLHTVHRRLLCAQLHYWFNRVTIMESDWQLKCRQIVFCCNRTMLLD